MSMEEIPKELIVKAAKGDISAFEGVYQMTSGFVYAVILGVVGQKELAEEVTQDVFINLYHKIGEFGFRSSFKTWLYRIAVNSAINAAKSHRRKNALQADFEGEVKHFKDPGDALEELHRRDNEELLKKVLEPLSSDQKTCLLLREMEGLSYKEIAGVLKVNLNTVRTWLKRAREYLIRESDKEVIKDGLQ